MAQDLEPRESSAQSPKNSRKAVKGKDKDHKDDVEELSEEDLELKNSLEMLLDRLSGPDAELYMPSLQSLRTLIRTSTSSMTSVPKPLKFLKPHKPKMVEIFETWPDGENKRLLADLLSIMAMTVYDGNRECLKYRLMGSSEELDTWGHEYVRHLSAEIGQEHAERMEKEADVQDLFKLGMSIVPFFLEHHAEADAVDLLLELEAIDKLPPFVDETTHARVCLYMLSCVPLLPPPDDVAFLRCVYEIYRKINDSTEAMAVALRLNDQELIRDVFQECPETNSTLKKQLCFLLARQGIHFEIPDNETYQSILNNTSLSEMFITLARELEVLEPRAPEDIYKTHLENTPRGFSGANVDSARHNLASTFVNAFVNAGFGSDKLLLGADENNPWIYKNKEHGMMSAAASIGMILKWDVDMGLSQMNKYLESSEDWIKAGALLGIGILNNGIRNESEPALALLTEYVEHENTHIKVAAFLGLGFAYAGTQKEEVLELILPFVSDTSVSMEQSAMASLALGLVFVGSCHGGITSSLLQALMERDPTTGLKDPRTRFMSLGLALLFLGKQEASEAPLEAIKTIEGTVGKQTAVLVEICSYAGTANVLKVQEMLHYCSEKREKEEKDGGKEEKEKGKDDESQVEEPKDTIDELTQQIAVIGIALVGMGEDIGTEMALRSFNHLMHYGDPPIRKSVPLALGLLCASNPVISVLDTLSKYSHDSDGEVALNAIFAMGLVGAGTNHARLAQMLRQLASYYYKEADTLFVVRIAQGLLHMGKGTMSINPYHSNRSLLSITAVAGLLATVLGFTDAKSLILERSHYLLYTLSCAMYPRFLITLTEDLKTCPVSVRVGQAVDTVGQAGKPKTITGFQTHSTPVLLQHGERAELATDEYVALSRTLEGFVIVRKNPEYMEEEADK